MNNECEIRHDGWRVERYQRLLVLPLGCAARAEVLHLVLLNVAIVLVQRPRERVGAVVAAHEIQKVGIGRVSRGLE